MVNNACRISKNHVESTLVFLIRRGKTLRVELDRHVQTLTNIEQTISLLEGTGFKVYFYDVDYSGSRFTDKSRAPVFVCLKG